MKNVVLCGVGGQGTVLASKLLAAAAMAQGENVHTAETIGMAQRGGSVVSHVRIGDGVYGPLVPKGQADLLIGFEPAEAVRNLPYLKAHGAIVVNSSPVKPVTDSLAETSYDGREMIDYLGQQELYLIVVDGDSLIQELGSAKSLNMALLAAACQGGYTGVSVEELIDAVMKTVKPAFHEENLRAIELGRAAVK
ncbi:MAG: indolepyruvate oxidoreductase subunit beta [Firmicutes bacterium]|nr:indolepyruvate oxidoreductase subunit beta [Bacillota bacterium]